ncbi:MAG: hypothetical protein ABW352_20320 [Polyangiales bacterium]
MAALLASCDRSDIEERDWRGPSVTPTTQVTQGNSAINDDWLLAEASGVLYAGRVGGGQLYAVRLTDAGVDDYVVSGDGLHALLVTAKGTVVVWGRAGTRKTVQVLCGASSAGIDDGGAPEVELAIDRGAPVTIAYAPDDPDAGASYRSRECLADSEVEHHALPFFYVNGSEDASLLRLGPAGCTKWDAAAAGALSIPPAEVTCDNLRLSLLPAAGQQRVAVDRRPHDVHVLRATEARDGGSLDGGALDAGPVEPADGATDAGATDAGATGADSAVLEATWSVLAWAPDRSAAVVSDQNRVLALVADRAAPVALDVSPELSFAISGACDEGGALAHRIVAYYRNSSSFHDIASNGVAVQRTAGREIEKVHIEHCAAPAVLEHDYSFSLLYPGAEAEPVGESAGLHVLDVAYAEPRGPLWLSLTDPTDRADLLLRISTDAEGDAGVTQVALKGKPIARTLGTYELGAYMLLAGRDGNLTVVTSDPLAPMPLRALDIRARCLRGRVPSTDDESDKDAQVAWDGSC